ncbi:hypothetical protein IH781_00765 [Patescibacteria group bacterium]|nr:hypothetical protein [Patescibacteria group bacterium]
MKVPLKAKGGQKGKPDKPGGGGGEETCYAFLANGANWKTTENYLLDPINSNGMSSTFVAQAMAGAVEAWDSEVATDVFGTEVAGAGGIFTLDR